MIPIFSVLFAPIAWLTRTPSVLWYAHGATPPTLRLAHALIDRAVTSTLQGFRLPSRKLDVIGQGIDLSIFPYRSRTPSDRFRIVTVGRVAPSKGQDVLIEALRGWRPPNGTRWELTIIGGPTSRDEEAFLARLRKDADSIPTSGAIRFVGRVPPAEIAHHLDDADVFVSLGLTGSLDKAIVESMAAGCPVLACNDAFSQIASQNGLEACVLDATPESIRAGLDRWLALPESDRKRIAHLQSEIAFTQHGLDGLIDKLLRVLRGTFPKKA